MDQGDAECITESAKAVISLLLAENAPGNRSPRQLQPSMATQNVRGGESNQLYDLDCATQEVVSALVEAQSEAGVVAGGAVRITKDLPPIYLDRLIGLPELRQHKRTFMKLATQASLSGPALHHDKISTKRMFCDYLRRELALPQ